MTWTEFKAAVEKQMAEQGISHDAQLDFINVSSGTCGVESPSYSVVVEPAIVVDSRSNDGSFYISG